MAETPAVAVTAYLRGFRPIADLHGSHVPALTCDPRRVIARLGSAILGSNGDARWAKLRSCRAWSNRVRVAVCAKQGYGKATSAQAWQSTRVLFSQSEEWRGNSIKGRASQSPLRSSRHSCVGACYGSARRCTAVGACSGLDRTFALSVDWTEKARSIAESLSSHCMFLGAG